MNSFWTAIGLIAGYYYGNPFKPSNLIFQEISRYQRQDLLTSTTEADGLSLIHMKFHETESSTIIFRAKYHEHHKIASKNLNLWVPVLKCLVLSCCSRLRWLNLLFLLLNFAYRWGRYLAVQMWSFGRYGFWNEVANNWFTKYVEYSIVPGWRTFPITIHQQLLSEGYPSEKYWEGKY